MNGKLLRTRQSLVWLILIAITLASWAVGHTGAAAMTSGAIALLLAFAKVAIVAWDFMEIRHAPLWLQIVTGAWVIGATTLLVSMYASVG